eukprot:gene35157-39767_t
MQYRTRTTPYRLARTSIALAVLTLAAQAAAQQAEAPMQKVEVTGSTIKRVASEMALPVTTVKADEFANAALTTVADVVTSMPAADGTLVEATGINRTL